MVKLATGWPEGSERTSGSRPRLPRRNTLLNMERSPASYGSEGGDGTIGRRLRTVVYLI
jgi:hypothetical protein